jgi:hypothetical protein
VLGLTGFAVRFRRLTEIGPAALAIWNFVLMANLTYVIRTGEDPGYARLLRGQIDALPYLPHLFAQGGVARSLVISPLLGGKADPAGALVLLLGESGCLIIAWLAVRGWRRREPASDARQLRQAAAAQPLREIV